MVVSWRRRKKTKMSKICMWREIWHLSESTCNSWLKRTVQCVCMQWPHAVGAQPAASVMADAISDPQSLTHIWKKTLHFKILSALQPLVGLENQNQIWNCHFKCIILSLILHVVMYKRQNIAFKMAIPKLFSLFQYNIWFCSYCDFKITHFFPVCVLGVGSCQRPNTTCMTS